MSKLSKLASTVLPVIVILFLVVVGTANWLNPVTSLPSHLQPQAAAFQAARGAFKNYAIVVVLVAALVLRARQAVAYLVLSFGVLEGGALALYVLYQYPLDPLWLLHLINGIIFIPAGVLLVQSASSNKA